MPQRAPLAWYFGIVFAITWIIGGAVVLFPEWVTAHLGRIDSSHPLYFIGVYAPTLTAFGLTALGEGRAGVLRLLARLDPRRPDLRWYAVVLIGIPVWSAGAGLVAGWLGGQPLAVGGVAAWLGQTALNLFRDAGPVGEEYGWRGYALPRMLRRWSPLTAAVLLGIAWGLWHLPAFYVQALNQSRLSLPWFVAGATALSVVSCWVFIHSKGSVLLAILLHLMANNIRTLLGLPFNTFAAGLVVAVVLIVAFGGLRPPVPAEALAGEAESSGPSSGR